MNWYDFLIVHPETFLGTAIPIIIYGIILTILLRLGLPYIKNKSQIERKEQND